MISTPLESQPLFLVGFMGCGKSAVGRQLASLLDRVFIDIDREIEQTAGSSIPSLIGRSGEREFRRIESEELIRASGVTGAVIATGGGIVLDAANRELMAGRGVSVWLDAPFELCWQRIESDGTIRPLAPDRETAFQRYVDRLVFYREAGIRAEITSQMTVRQIAKRIAELLASAS